MNFLVGRAKNWKIFYKMSMSLFKVPKSIFLVAQMFICQQWHSTTKGVGNSSGFAGHIRDKLGILI